LSGHGDAARRENNANNGGGVRGNGHAGIMGEREMMMEEEEDEEMENGRRVRRRVEEREEAPAGEIAVYPGGVKVGGPYGGVPGLPVLSLRRVLSTVNDFWEEWTTNLLQYHRRSAYKITRWMPNTRENNTRSCLWRKKKAPILQMIAQVVSQDPEALRAPGHPAHQQPSFNQALLMKLEPPFCPFVLDAVNKVQEFQERLNYSTVDPLCDRWCNSKGENGFKRGRTFSIRQYLSINNWNNMTAN
jgi:hypothetical protein